MNFYSALLYKIKELGEANAFVNTISHGAPSEKDLNKKTIFPLLNIEVQGGRFTNGRTVVLSVLIECMTIRDIVKHEEVEDKVFGKDNLVDNMATCLEVLNDIWTKLERDLAKSGIRALENPTLDAMEGVGVNLMDGWSLNVDIEFSNVDKMVC